ncbi:hypothetical protein CEXT_3371 [Caerostris extrusa]|uniref:Uncharacterized protein n=1 Tax=Caerostris extrusa TaxID=172846 RepID=A0AAV4QNG5_CAEEX|nr:hypothetical protein CEXT_3371 [Caerostris extrusa]
MHTVKFVTQILLYFKETFNPIIQKRIQPCCCVGLNQISRRLMRISVYTQRFETLPIDLFGSLLGTLMERSISLPMTQKLCHNFHRASFLRYRSPRFVIMDNRS